MGKRKGFTLVEVTLFLAITALLFLGIAMGVQNSVFQQRYNDSTQSFLEFMRSVYSKVLNPQTVGKGDGGDNDKAIYGKLIAFGESEMLDGANNSNKAIFVYDVIGDADTVGKGLGTGTVKDMLKRLNASIVRVTSVDAANNVTGAEFVAAEKYTPHWGASIDGLTNGTPFTGSILVVRHPRSGTINTLFNTQVLEANETLKDAKDGATNYNGIVRLLIDKMDGFNSDTTINFCVNPNGAGLESNVRRQNIRIIKNARNASDVQIMNLDSNYDATNNPEGNQC